MKREENHLIVQEMNGWNMEIGEHGYVFLEREHWRGESMMPPFSRLYLVMSGNGWIRMGDTLLRLQAGRAYLLPAGLSIQYGCDDYVKKLYFHLRLIRPDGYDLAEGAPFVAQCPLEQAQLTEMLGYYRGQSWRDVLRLQQQIGGLAIQLLEQYEVLGQPLRTFSPPVQQAMQYIRSHLAANLTAKQVAQALFVSETALSRRFRQESGKTIHQYLEDMVFQTACKQLIETDRPLSAISEELGFCDPFYFSRRFRQRFGEPPSRYRKRLKHWG